MRVTRSPTFPKRVRKRALLQNQIEEKIDNTMSSSSGSSCSSVGKRKKKKDIPNTVKVSFCGMLCAYLNLIMVFPERN